MLNTKLKHKTAKLKHLEEIVESSIFIQSQKSRFHSITMTGTLQTKWKEGGVRGEAQGKRKMRQRTLVHGKGVI